MKILWLDVETTGKDPRRNGIIELACIIEIGNEVAEEQVFRMNPIGKEISEEALAVHGISLAQIQTYPSAKEVKKEIESFFSRYVNRYDKTDKFIPAGFNVRFDIDFLNSLWEDSGDPYLFGYIRGGVELDIYRAVFFAKWCGYPLVLPDYKLLTLAKSMNVNIQSHDALSDIKATREIAYKLKDFFKTEKIQK